MFVVVKLLGFLILLISSDLCLLLIQVILLSGPAGIGKTTLATFIAQHAGYAVSEVNARCNFKPFLCAAVYSIVN